MEDVLKQLLDAEIEAEALVEEAEAKRTQIVQQAREEAQQAEHRLEQRIPELRDSFLKQSEEKAGQTIAELKRRYQERQKDLHKIAEAHRAEAVTAALSLMLDTERA